MALPFMNAGPQRHYLIGEVREGEAQQAAADRGWSAAALDDRVGIYAKSGGSLT
jgi:hypothetical protein